MFIKVLDSPATYVEVKAGQDPEKVRQRWQKYRINTIGYGIDTRETIRVNLPKS